MPSSRCEGVPLHVICFTCIPYIHRSPPQALDLVQEGDHEFRGHVATNWLSSSRSHPTASGIGQSSGCVQCCGLGQFSEVLRVDGGHACSPIE